MLDILEELLEHERKFSELERLFKGLSSKVLSQRMKELFDMGLVSKVVSSITPLDFVYRISPAGDQIRKVLYEMAIFGSTSLRQLVFEEPNISRHVIEEHFQKVYLT